MKRAQAAAAANTAAGGSTGQAQKSAAGGGPPQLVKVPVAQGSSPAHGMSASTLKSPQVFAMLCTCSWCYQKPCHNCTLQTILWELCKCPGHISLSCCTCGFPYVHAALRCHLLAAVNLVQDQKAKASKVVAFVREIRVKPHAHLECAQTPTKLCSLDTDDLLLATLHVFTAAGQWQCSSCQG